MAQEGHRLPSQQHDHQQRTTNIHYTAFSGRRRSPSPSRSRSRSRGDPSPSQPVINIYNTNDAHQERSRQGPRDRAASQGNMAFQQNWGVYPNGPGYIQMPLRERSRSRRRSRSSSRSRSRSRGRYRREEEYRRNIIADQRRKDEQEERERELAIEKYKLDAAKREREDKEAELDAVRKHEQRKKDDADKEKKAWEAYEAKRKKIEEDEKAKKKKDDEAYQERMRKHLSTLGYSSNQIDTIIEAEKIKENNKTQGTMVYRPRGSRDTIAGGRGEALPKIRRSDIEDETLNYYKLQWEYAKDDPSFIIIMRPMTEKETNVLFKHTDLVRSRGRPVLAIGDRKHKDKDNDLLLVRRSSKKGRDRSKSRDRRDRSASRSVRLANGILGL